jgi:SHS2 domain-containing protein
LGIEEAFQECAKAMFNVEINIDKVEPKRKVKIRCSAKNQEELLVEWLNALLAQASIKEMVFSDFKVIISKEINSFQLEGEAKGDKLSEKHEPKIEVKAATYSQVRVYHDEDKSRWVVQCIVDV